MLEFALASLVIVPCFAGTFQFGYSFYVYNQLESAISNGARYAATRTYRCLAGTTDTDKIKTAIRNVVQFGNPDGSGNSQVPQLSNGNIAVTFNYSGTAIPTSITVAINTFTVDAVFKAFTFTGKPTVTFPYLGRYAPNESEP
ncbi:MAG TPA: TadE/TadG family type IV pilus assembly protein [Bryobacteraceae bacterium]|nr:TadE/TadG family type IV pilus assembly protein [Bryobacteraceae bacterium]